MRTQPHELIVDQQPHQIVIYRTGQSAPLLVQHADPDQRPFLHPLRAPDGDGTLTENAPPHHPWQHGLYVGLNDVNGIGFWTEGLTGNATDGTFHPQPLTAATVTPGCCQWSVLTDWRHPDGCIMLHESQAWTLRDGGEYYELDLTWSLTAQMDLTFGDYAYGGLFIRMPFLADNRDRSTVVNSEGQRGPTAAEAQPARWVAIAMPIPDRKAAPALAGVAMMDHPSNPGHPVPWRVDGQFGIAPSRCITGAWKLTAGARSVARHRMLIHTGPTDIAAVESSWSRFVS